MKKTVCFILVFCVLLSAFFSITTYAENTVGNSFELQSSIYTVTVNNPLYDGNNTITNIPCDSFVNEVLYNLRNENPDLIINIFTYNNKVPSLFDKISLFYNRRMYITVRENPADVAEKFILIPQAKTELNCDFEKYPTGIFQNDDSWNFTKSKQNVGDAFIAEELNDRICKIVYTEKGDAYPALETALLNLPQGSKSELTFSIRNEKNTVYVRLRDGYSSATNHYIEPIQSFGKTIRCFSSKNYITNSNGENLSIANGTWVKFKVVFDRTNSDDSQNTISVFLNDEAKASKTAKFSNYPDFNWDEFKIQFGASPSSEFTTLSQCSINDFSYSVISNDSSKASGFEYHSYYSDESNGLEHCDALVTGSNKIKVKIKSASYPLTIYVAEKSDGELVNLRTYPIENANDNAYTLTTELTVTDAVNNSIELYVWQDNTIKPVGTVVTPNMSQVSIAAENGHPRVLANAKIFENIVSSDNAKHTTWKNTVVSYADTICSSYTTIDVSSGFYVGKLVSFSESANRFKKFASVLGMAYQLTGNKKYSDMFFEMATETSNHVGWTDGTSDNLTVAYMTEGYSIGFDWCYHGLTNAQKQAVANIVTEKCFNFALNEYYGTSRNSHTWSVTYTNHNSIPNSSFIVASIAFAEYSPALCQTVLDYSSERLKIFLAGLFPDGGWWEGASYTNLVYSHLAKASETLKINFGSDNIIANTSFINNSADFFIGTMGPNGSYNFAEQKSPSQNTIPEMFWLANVSGKDYVSAWAVQRINFENALNCALALVWLNNPDELPEYEFSNNYTRGTEQITLGSGNSGNASWLSVLGGTNYGSHKHLDLGSFIYDCNGVRWATELGYENYYKGYHAETSAEKIFYRSRAEGHNTLVINPTSANGGQRMNDSAGIANAEVVKYNLRNNSPFAVYNLTNAYSDNASRVMRGFKLLNNNIGFIVRDEFETTSDTDSVYWFMHTEAQITLSANGKTATLLQDGKKMVLNVFEDNLIFEVTDAMTSSSIKSELLTYSQNNGLELHKQNTNQGIKKLQIKHSGSKRGSITVIVAPENTIIPADYNLPLENWD